MKSVSCFLRSLHTQSGANVYVHTVRGSVITADCIATGRWGFGKYTCPGRFYAIRLPKLVFVELRLDYWKGEPRAEHPPSSEVQGQFLPNAVAEFRFG